MVEPAEQVRGEALLHGIDLAGLGFKVLERTATPRDLYVVLAK